MRLKLVNYHSCYDYRHYCCSYQKASKGASAGEALVNGALVSKSGGGEGANERD